MIVSNVKRTLLYNYDVLQLHCSVTRYKSATYLIGTAGKAVDGNRNSDLGAGSCTHTLDNTPVWWMVDLGEDFTVTNVIITSRNQGSM